jgi:predicted deacetylase
VQPLLAVEIHDVAPATWPRCEALLDMVARTGAAPVTLLVVPFYHRTVSIDRAPAFARAIGARIERGDEVALHGFTHVDEAPRPRTLRGFIERRVLTRSEGEFAAIDRDEARERLERALAIWRRVGWPIGGFVPPAWLLGRGARAALAPNSPFRYVALRRTVLATPYGRAVATDTMWYSPASAPRRAMSRALAAFVDARASPQRLLRLALHPQDADVRSVLDDWRRVIERALAQRAAASLGTALASIVDATQAGRARVSGGGRPSGNVVSFSEAARARPRARRSRRSSGR